MHGEGSMTAFMNVVLALGIIAVAALFAYQVALAAGWIYEHYH